MLFNSINFFVFFLIILLMYYIIPIKFRHIWLLISSYYFYMQWNVSYILLLFSSTILTYIAGICIGRLEFKKNDNYIIKKKICVALTVIANLGILFLFKYYNFTVDSVNCLLSKMNLSIIDTNFNLLLPVGISFYTFQALGYIIDVYRGNTEPQKDFIKYALFVSFFLTINAGPIERSTNLLKQFEEKRTFDYYKAYEGIGLMIWGYFLKLVLADRIAIFVNTTYEDIETYGGTFLLVAVFLYGFQIYCDFSGYSAMAIGAAKILGYDLMENFNAPYLSKSVAEFWRRWHISLSSWFKDYLYIPLGGNRKGIIGKYKNLMIVFLLSGLWHGASWNFVVWGGLNGIYQVVGEEFKRVKKKTKILSKNKSNTFSNKLLQVMSTFFLIDFAWIFFRADNFMHALDIIKSICTTWNPWVFIDGSLYTAGLSRASFNVVFFGIILLIMNDVLKYRKIKLTQKFLEQSIWFRTCIISVSIVLIALIGIWGGSYNASNFIYFQF